MIIVRVTSPIGRDVYVNQNYGESAGQTPTSIDLDAGSHTFETLNAAGVVDYRESVTDVPDGGSRTIALKPVP